VDSRGHNKRLTSNQLVEISAELPSSVVINWFFGANPVQIGWKQWTIWTQWICFLYTMESMDAISLYGHNGQFRCLIRNQTALVLRMSQDFKIIAQLHYLKGNFRNKRFRGANCKHREH